MSENQSENQPENQLIIRFRGIVTHLDLNGKRPKGMKRMLLLRHLDTDTPIEHHISYIECLADDLESAPGLKVVKYSRPGTDGTFARIDLPDDPGVMTEIKLEGVDPGPVHEEANYRNDVTHFKDLLKNFSDLKIESTLLGELAANVDASRTVAVFDMPKGRLMAGEPEAFLTRFDPKLVKSFTPRRLPRWVDLLVTVPSPNVELKLVQPGGELPLIIRFKPTLRMITIGNEPERLILGIIGGNGGHAAAGHTHGNGNGNGGRTQPSGHFVIHYNVFDPVPKDKPVPIPTQLEGGGCGTNNIP
jgi:hypothetical protein